MQVMLKNVDRPFCRWYNPVYFPKCWTSEYWSTKREFLHMFCKELDWGTYHGGRSHIILSSDLVLRLSFPHAIGSRKFSCQYTAIIATEMHHLRNVGVNFEEGFGFGVGSQFRLNL